MLSGMASPQASPNPPTKISRVHSNSTSMAAPVHTSPPARKRTSSGIFQVDDSEPLPKKSELTRSLSDSPRKKSEAIANGCQKIIVKEKIDKKEKATEKKEGKQMKELKKTKIVVTFDSEAKSKCVSAFKESDNWD